MRLEKSHAATVENLEGRCLFANVIGLTHGSELIRFDTLSPQNITTPLLVKSLAPGDRIVGIDYRPANGKLYGLVNGRTVDRIIEINANTGASTTAITLSTQLVGNRFSVDFNPVADALRIISDLDQNLRVAFASGATFVDGNINYAANDINGGKNPVGASVAYTNSFPGTTATVLYTIDSTLDSLTVQNPPNAGTLVTRGPLGVNSDASIGFDIQAASSNANFNGTAYVSLTRNVDNFSRFYTISLQTGGVRDVGPIGGSTGSGLKLKDISVVPVGASVAGGYNLTATTSAPAARAVFNTGPSITSTLLDSPAGALN